MKRKVYATDTEPSMKRAKIYTPGSPLAKGAFNQVLDVNSKPSLVIRQTIPGRFQELQDAKKEAAMTRMMHILEIHPKVEAMQVTALNDVHGTSAYIMDKGTSFTKWLEIKDASMSEGASMARQLLKHLCTISDLGLCLFDLKPDNAVVLPNQTLKLIDFDPSFSVFMEDIMINLLTTGNKNVGCARFRGVSLYLMILQWYYMVRKSYFNSLRKRGFLVVLRAILHKSQLPLDDVLIKGHLARSELVRLFLLFARHYTMIEGLTTTDENDLLEIKNNITREGLIKAEAEEVVVMSVPYANDAATCSSSEKRHAILGMFGDVKYPCPYTQKHAINALQVIGENVLHTNLATNITRQDNSVSSMRITNNIDESLFHADDNIMYHSADTQYSSARP